MSPASPGRNVRAVTGPASIGHPLTRAIERGFTLVEMLVVLLIMGLLVGLVSASAQPDDRAVLRLEVDRLAQLMDLAATEAHLTGKTIAWTANEPTYRFWKFSEDLGWLPIVDDVLRARALPQGMTLSGMRLENFRSPEQMRVEFTPYGPAVSFSVDMSLGEARYTLANSPIGEVRVLPQGGTGNEKLVRR